MSWIKCPRCKENAPTELIARHRWLVCTHCGYREMVARLNKKKETEEIKKDK